MADKRKGVSLSLDDAVDAGLFSSGPARVKESIFAMFDYSGNSKSVAVWLITYEREGETYEQPYSLGKGWKVSADGTELIPMGGQTGLPKSCNAIKHLISPLVKKAGAPSGIFEAGDPTVLDGLDCVVVRVEQEKREGLKQSDKERSILEIHEIVSAPWDKKGGKSKSKAKDTDDDDEKPRHKDRGSKDDDDDDDDDKPAKRKSRTDDDDDDEKPAKGKSKAKPAADDDASEVDEEAIEALIEALEDGPIKADDIEDEVRGRLKGNKQAKAIAARAADPDFLEQEKGWSWNGKRVTLDK